MYIYIYIYIHAHNTHTHMQQTKHNSQVRTTAPPATMQALAFATTVWWATTL